MPLEEALSVVVAIPAVMQLAACSDGNVGSGLQHWRAGGIWHSHRRTTR